MLLTVSSKIIEEFPELKIGYILAKNIDNQGTIPLSLIQQTENIEQKLRQQFPDMPSLSSHPMISLWRDIYKKMGSKPNKFLPTVEALTRRVIKGGQLPHLNKAVNAYIISELETLMPVGGYDLDTLEGDISLRYATANEVFVGMDGVEDFTYAGEIIYADNVGVLTRRWNYRDCKKSQISEKSQNIVLFTEAPTSDITVQSLEKTLQLMSDLLGIYCGGVFQLGVMDCKKDNYIQL